jgi:hypothetical protein
MGRARNNKTAVSGDGFTSVFGRNRGPMSSAPTHPQSEIAQTLLDAVDLAGASRVVARYRLKDLALLRTLSDALALEALEYRWGGRTRAVLRVCGAIPSEAEHLLRDRARGLIHLWPDGDAFRGAYRHVGKHTKKERAACGLLFDDDEHFPSMSRAERGSWLSPDLNGYYRDEREHNKWKLCADCAVHASEYADCTEPAAYPVFERDEFKTVRAILAESLLTELIHNPRQAGLGFARAQASTNRFLSEQILHACAIAAEGGGRETWEVALRVLPNGSYRSYGLSLMAVENALGPDFDPKGVVTVADWDEALAFGVAFVQRRGRDFGVQFEEFARRLWEATLTRVQGPEHKHSGVVFSPSR